MPTPSASFHLFPRVLDPSWLGQLRVRAEAAYGELFAPEPRNTSDRDPAREKRWPRVERSSSSVGLEALGSGVHASVMEKLLCERKLRGMLHAALGNEIVYDLDQAWLRRQFAPSRYPPGHAPHSWHQDGALGFDFAALGNAEPPPDALLDIITCWIPLTPCGDDAPGLELIGRQVNRLLTPRELTDDHLRGLFPSEAFVAPAMEPGDVLVLDPGCLHRTHVTPLMRRDRTSVELRFLAAGRVLARLSGDRFQALPPLSAA